MSAQTVVPVAQSCIPWLPEFRISNAVPVTAEKPPLTEIIDVVVCTVVRMIPGSASTKVPTIAFSYTPDGDVKSITHTPAGAVTLTASANQNRHHRRVPFG